MSLWIKICGNTTLADALLAVEAGADAVGFVFAQSPRRVSVEQVAAITAKLPPEIEKIGVFVDANFTEIDATVRECGLTGVQLHFRGVESDGAKLRTEFGPELRILRVVHFDAQAERSLEQAVADANVDAVLVDSRTATAVGGTGIAFDWQAARARVFGDAGRVKMIAAGGLTPANVGEAIRVLRPWGVDVVTGVEASPGTKDAAKVREFVANARRLNPNG